MKSTEDASAIIPRAQGKEACTSQDATQWGSSFHQ